MNPRKAEALMSKHGIMQVIRLFLVVGLIFVFASQSRAQNFDFNRLQKQVQAFSVIIDMDIDISFGMQSTTEKERYLGTIVTNDGLVIFNGTALDVAGSLATLSGFNVKTSPKKISIETMSGKKYSGEYIGVDRYTNIGFIKMTNPSNDKFTPVSFAQSYTPRIGSWVALYMLLPDFITPPLMADIGMVSTIVTSPEKFPLTVGFGPMMMTSVVFDDAHRPVGVLGSVLNPSSGGSEMGSFDDSQSDFQFPLLGVITADRIAKLVADPPKEGSSIRGWLGITLQAVTKDMADYWGLTIDGGIVVGDIVKNSPGARAGIQVGDIIYSANGRPVEVDKEEKIPIFQRMIADLGPGTIVRFGIFRPRESGADTLTIEATLEKAPLTARDAEEYRNEPLEFTCRNLVFSDINFYNLDPETFKGVVVSELTQGGVTDIGGLNLGDVIQRIGSDAVTNIDEAKTAMEKLASEKPKEVVFFVWRDRKTMFVNVKATW
jgi:serine protease Do